MDPLHMFAIMPPKELAEAIDKERKLFADKYNCVKALKPPVHITLYPPFPHPDDFKSRVSALHQWATTQVGFPVSLSNFNFFKNKNNPVVYIDVEKNPQLSQFHRHFVSRIAKYIQVIESKTYSPHFTIGYRDVPVELMPAIEKDYSRRRFSAAFDVKSFFLWRHDGKNWRILDEYCLGQNNQLF